jgi:glutamyl-tRNA synthetase
VPNNPKVRTRFAPSPTGNLHIGGVRTALFSWLYAKKHQGEFILRIEDTDTQRSTQESTQAILRNLKWLGITPTNEPIFQSHRLERYRQVAEQLVSQGKAYYCDCDEQRLDELRTSQKAQNLKPQYDRKCRQRSLSPSNKENCVIRLKTPIEGEIHFKDLVYGDNIVNNKELDDLIIIRSDGSPTYNFAVVLDDIENQITHIIRGDDHLNNTSRQIHLYNILNAPIPQFAHCPMVLGNDGKRLSKRHGATDVGYYRQQGFLPTAVLNYLIRLGWSHGDQEIFTIDEMINLFELTAINRASPKFDLDKFLWINQQILRSTPTNELAENYQQHINKLNLQNSQNLDLNDIVELYCERCQTIEEIAAQSAFLFQQTHWENHTEIHQEHIAPNKETLTSLQQILTELPESQWNAEKIMQTIKEFSKQKQLKMFQVGMPFRVALSAQKNTPDISKIATILGKELTLSRLKHALES